MGQAVSRPYIGVHCRIASAAVRRPKGDCHEPRIAWKMSVSFGRVDIGQSAGSAGPRSVDGYPAFAALWEMHLARRSHSECSEIYRRNNGIAVPGFILPGAPISTTPEQSWAPIEPSALRHYGHSSDQIASRESSRW